MGIQARCEHCGNTYQAADNLAGRKVRCRKCGQIFTITASQLFDTVQLSQNDLQTLGEGESNDNGSAGAAPDAGQGMPPVTQFESNMTGGEGSAKSKMQRPATDPGTFGFTDQSPIDYSYGTPVSFDFPFADDLDRWLPGSIVLLMLSWVLYIAGTWQPSSTPALWSNSGWASAAICGVYTLAFVVIWIPMIRFALGRSAANLRFSLPTQPLRRSAAIAAVPFALGALLWLASESFYWLFIGMLFGFVPATAGAWFLLRLRQKDIVYAATALVISGVVATLLSIGLIVGVNTLLAMGLVASHNTRFFAASPLGPALYWPEPSSDVPPVVAKPPKTGSAIVTPSPAPGNAATPVIPAPGPDRPAVTMPLPLTPDRETVVVVAPAPFVPLKPNQLYPVADKPLVESVQAVVFNQPITQVIYPLTGSDAFAVVHPTATPRDVRVEAWRREPLTRLGGVSFAGNPADSSFAVSPSGDTVARIATLPSLNVQAWAFVDAQPTQYPVESGTPRILGFTSNTTLLYEVRNGFSNRRPWAYQVFSLDLISGVMVRVLAYADSHSSIVALSPDNRYLAAVRNDAAGQNFCVYGITANIGENPKLGRSPVAIVRVAIPQTAAGATAPVLGGIAFSPAPAKKEDAAWATQGDAKPETKITAKTTLEPLQVAVAFEQANQLAISIYGVSDGKLAKSFVFPGGISLNTGGMKDTESRLIWLENEPNGRSILLYAGRLIIDANTGRILSDLELPILQQHAISGSRIHLLTFNAAANGAPQLLDITLNLAK